MRLRIIPIIILVASSLADSQQDSLADVFPLALSNSWGYHFYHWNDNIETGYTVDTGQADLTVLDSVWSPDTISWIIQEHRRYRDWGDGIRGPHSINIDTTVQFIVAEVQSDRHRLSVSGSTFIYGYVQTLPESLALYRYQRPDSSGYLTITNIVAIWYGAKFVYQQGVGLYSDSISAGDWGREVWNVNLLGSTILGVDEDKKVSPKQFRLSQNYPNPFNPSTQISYTVPRTSAVTLTVYDVLGRVVATLVDGMKTPGGYTVVWDARHLASGLYIYQMVAGNFTASKKAFLVR